MKIWRSSFVLFLIALSTVVQAQSGDWKQLFNGKDLVGWKHVGPGEMVIQDGVIKTSGAWDCSTGLADSWRLCNPRGVQDGTPERQLRRLHSHPLEPREAWMPVNYGYEIQIDNNPDDYHSTGVVYSFSKAMARPGKPDQSGTLWRSLWMGRALASL